MNLQLYDTPSRTYDSPKLRLRQSPLSGGYDDPFRTLAAYRVNSQRAKREWRLRGRKNSHNLALYGTRLAKTRGWLVWRFACTGADASWFAQKKKKTREMQLLRRLTVGNGRTRCYFPAQLYLLFMMDWSLQWGFLAGFCVALCFSVLRNSVLHACTAILRLQLLTFRWRRLYVPWPQHVE